MGGWRLLVADLWIAGTTGTLSVYRGSPTAASGTSVISTSGRPAGLAIDTTASKVYWVNGSLIPQAVQRAGFDGTGLETLSATEGTGSNTQIGGIAVDPGNALYWYAAGVGIRRVSLASANTSGTGQLIVPGVASSQIAVAGGKLYYNDALSSSLYRSELDGTNAQVVVPHLVDDFAVDYIGNHIYWLRWFDFASLNLFRTNLDGSGQQIAASGSQFTDDFNLAGFVVDPWQKTILIASSDYVQTVPDGNLTARAKLTAWATNVGGIALSGCATP